MTRSLRVVALLTVRNEELYLDRCLRHLINQGVEVCVIDNDSTDSTMEIARRYYGQGVFRIESIPFKGFFELQKILCNEERLAKHIDADWFMHHDADEIREPPPPYLTLLEAITEVDRLGYNAINFDEYVFLPTRESKDELPADYVSDMRHYYFYEPIFRRQVKLWKKEGQQVDLVTHAGHCAQFLGRRIYPRSFIMRHYIALSPSHMRTKYSGRKFSPHELALGWHTVRKGLDPSQFSLPFQKELTEITHGKVQDKSRPFRYHRAFERNVAVGKGFKQFVRRFIQRLSA